MTSRCRRRRHHLRPPTRGSPPSLFDAAEVAVAGRCSASLVPVASKIVMRAMERVQVSETAKFAVLDPAGTKHDHVAAAQAGSAAAAAEGRASGSGSSGGGRAKTRLTKSTGKLVQEGQGKIGGAFMPQPMPGFIDERKAVYERAAAVQVARLSSKPREPIWIRLADGAIRPGTSYETTPMDVAKGLSNSLAKEVLVAEVSYTRRIADDEAHVSSADGLEADAAGADGPGGGKELWDLLRPLIGDCELRFLTWEDREAQAVFWHSSAHCLGLAMERKYGCHLTHGPPIENGFFYDCCMGAEAVPDRDLKDLDKDVQRTCKAKQTFDRLLLSKDEALDMFKYNAFKRQYIETRIPDGGCTTVYRNGDFIDLCRGPHVPYTTVIQAFAATRASGTNWLGKVGNDPLQRIYGVSFPDKARLKKWQEFQEQAKLRDHRRLGQVQELFFFHELSPGSAFFLPHGARLYNRLMEFIRKEYWRRGYQEVGSPNMYNMDLWEQSGHAMHYRENMFRFDVEGQEFGLKPMNCPGHCLMFAHRARSYRELPLRLADFGVLHRNELSGALSGLTRVRRFCQDDAHIFCREDQIRDEVKGSLEFMKAVYDIFGMTYKLELSTKPEKALGDEALWEMAEGSLAAALDDFAGPGKWRVNPGDGAFYGPKIDIKVFDAMERVHQCATIQLDFQLPIRFGLRYRTAEDISADAGTTAAAAAGSPAADGAAASAGGAAAGGAAADGAAVANGRAPPLAAPTGADAAATAAADGAAGTSKEGKRGKGKSKGEEGAAAKADGAKGGGGGGGFKGGGGGGGAVKSVKGGAAKAAEEVATGGSGDGSGTYKRPVMVHRAMLGSVERMVAILTEHYGGRWPFWLSPRQALVVPVAQSLIPYASAVRDRLHDAGFYVDVEDSSKTLNKKVREGETARYNFILVVGQKEEEKDECNVRAGGNVQLDNMTVDAVIAKFRRLCEEHK